MAEGPNQEGNRRRRVFKPKTRTGCITCRIRRIKCDEFKPACLKCTNTGRKCDGYTSTTSSRSSSKDPPPNSITISTKTIMPKLLLPQMSLVPFEGTKLELHAFRYFQQETVPQICGFYRDQFWLQSVLQACHHNPAIRHAAIALGSLHEQSATYEPPVPMGVGDLVTGSFALQQYNKAIQSLLKPVPGSFRKPQQKVDVALITCILFACFDALRGHLGTVFDHIDGGVKILSEIQSKITSTDQENETSALYAPLSTLNTLFTRLDIQGCLMLGTRRLRLVPPPEFGPSIESITIPLTFHSFEQARDSQDTIFRCWHLDFRRTLTNGAELPFAEIPSREESQFLKTTYNNRLSEWNAAYSNFLDEHPEKADVPADHVLKLLKIHLWLHVVIDHAAAAEDEMYWDKYTPQFKEMVYHAKIVIASTAEISRKRVLFSLDTMLMSPLYFVASRCRHPAIRREAIHCLVTANRQEGLWESRTLARVAQKVMEIEEEGMGVLIDGTEIPNWKRVNGVHPVLDSDGRRAVIHYTSRPAEEGGLPLTNMKEPIEW